MLAAGSNFASYLATEGDWHYDFFKLTAGAGIIWGYCFGAPILYWLYFKWVDLNVSLIEMLCIYGYSLFSYTPVAVCFSFYVNDFLIHVDLEHHPKSRRPVGCCDNRLFAFYLLSHCQHVDSSSLKSRSCSSDSLHNGLFACWVWIMCSTLLVSTIWKCPHTSSNTSSYTCSNTNTFSTKIINPSPF